METNGEKLLMRCDRITLELPEKNENVDGTACADLLALRGQKFDQNRPLWIGRFLKLCFFPRKVNKLAFLKMF